MTLIQRALAESFLEMTSITKKRIILLSSVLFYLLLWQLIAMAVGQDILLVSPIKVLLRLFELITEPSFWRSIMFSTLRIALGFFSALAASLLLAVLSARFPAVRVLLYPLVSAIKATPVASIVIVILIWISSRNLSVVISFMMVFPVFYSNILEGIINTDKGLLEMAKVFQLPFGKKLKAIYFPAVLPYFRSASTVALGLCWKSGVAAEVIGIPTGSIGEKLYEAKVFFATEDVFAWTITIILLSLLFEKVLGYLIKVVTDRMVHL